MFRIGMTPADDGTAYIHHYDIHDYLTLVRSCIGVCSQEDILFGDLSVMEHLLLFAWVLCTSLFHIQL